jgi:SAM-dependent methyltransferase
MSAESFFDAIAKRYDRVFAREPSETRARLARVLELLGPPADVLDLGVGTGLELPALLDAGHRVVGIDVSAGMIAECEKRSRRVPCIRADFWTGLPVGDASFDAVIALFGTLAHAPDETSIGKLAAEIARVLRPSGFFYAEVPTEAWVAQHPRFFDEVTGTSIAIRPFGTSAFAGFVVSNDDRGDERVIVARLRSPPSPAAP